MTAMEELIEYCYVNSFDLSINDIVRKGNKLLQKEKEQIEEAFDAGSAYEVPDDLHYGLKYSTFQDWQKSLKTTATK